MTRIEREYSGVWGYEVHFVADGRASWRISCTSVPELDAVGSSKAEALRNGCYALDQVIAGRMRVNDTVPPFDRLPAPSPGEARAYVTLRATDVLKVHLYMALRRKGWSRADLMRQLQWHRNQVDRLFEIGHGSRLDQIQDAAEVLDLSLDARLTMNVEGFAVQVTEDGDGWRVRLATEDPEFAGESLTREALGTEQEARLIAIAVKRALDLVGAA